jgi:hypothetical protein
LDDATHSAFTDDCCGRRDGDEPAIGAQILTAESTRQFARLGVYAVDAVEDLGTPTSFWLIRQ